MLVMNQILIENTKYFHSESDLLVLDEVFTNLKGFTNAKFQNVSYKEEVDFK